MYADFRMALAAAALAALTTGVVEAQCGDCNSSGSVDIVDALTGAQHGVGPGPALALIDALAASRSDRRKLESYQPYHAARADLLRRAGDRDAAAAAYRRAIDLAEATPERRFLERRLAEVLA